SLWKIGIDTYCYRLNSLYSFVPHLCFVDGFLDAWRTSNGVKYRVNALNEPGRIVRRAFCDGRKILAKSKNGNVRRQTNIFPVDWNTASELPSLSSSDFLWHCV